MITVTATRTYTSDCCFIDNGCPRFFGGGDGTRCWVGPNRARNRNEKKHTCRILRLRAHARVQFRHRRSCNYYDCFRVPEYGLYRARSSQKRQMHSFCVHQIRKSSSSPEITPRGGRRTRVADPPPPTAVQNV